MTVLIVDDEDGIRETLHDVFQDEGYDVAVASNGFEAMEQLRSLPKTCVVILDIVMPGMDGVEVWNAMQSDPRLATIPVVVTTSDPSRAPPDVLTMRKPVDLELLVSTIARICKRTES